MMDSLCSIVDYDTDDDSIEESPPYNLQLLPEGSPVPDEGIKAPICPRIGEEYQVEVPDFLVEPETIPADNQFLIGLPVPLTWVDDHEKHGRVPENGGHVPENGGHAPENGGHVPENGGHAPEKDGHVTETDGHVPGKEGHVPVPGIGTSHWNETEAKGLVLGLYIFGKNLQLITRFVASKSIGDVLAYYYGVFYKSETYKKWVDCRKVRNRKCIVGTRIFTGWRQQELVSRLQSAVPQEKHEPVLEAIKSFNDNIFTFEDFVFFLRSTISLQTFVDAVAIGKGLDDLTGPGPDSGRAAHPAPSRSEIPSGKACSSLSPTEIIKFLTGDFRLSKAKANDLFWEAIWPRLLARGWHSEQPRDLIGSKNSLVFLLPGIKKFSRKLTKGVHYYDCVSDVLKKVGAEPELLEIDNIMTGNVDGECVPGNTSVSPKEYLRPKSRSQEGAEFMRFMVVDTSMLYDEKKMRVRDFKSLPSDINLGKEPLLSAGQFRIAIPSDSSDSEDDKQSRVKRRESGSGNKASDVNLVRNSTPQVDGVLLGCSSVIDAAGNGHVETTSVANDMQGHFGQFSRSSKPKVHKYLSPVPKRRRLSGCKQQGASQKSVPFPKGNSNEAGPDGLVLSAAVEEGREGEPLRRRRKIKFLVKDVMKEGTELESGSSGRVEAVQKGDSRAEPVPLHNAKEVGASTSAPPRKKKVREPKVVRNEPNCGLKMAGDQTKIEFDSSDKVIESVKGEAPTKRKRKVTFLFREAVQTDDNAMPHFFNGSVTGTLHGAGVSKKPKLPVRRKPKPSVKEVKKETELLSIPDPVHEITQHEKIEIEIPKPQPVKEEPKDLQPNVPETAPTDVGTSGTSNALGPSEPNAVTSGRRTGTRKRPPTERSLLAVAYGFLEAPKQRNVSASPRRARKSGEASRKRRKMEETAVPVPSEDAAVVVMGAMVAGESSQGNTDQPVVEAMDDLEPKEKTSDRVAQVELST